MAKILIAPGKYLQGKGEMRNLGTYAAGYGSKALILISDSGKNRFGPLLETSFSQTTIDMYLESFNGECSKGEVARLRQVAQSESCNVIIGVGGGKILDTAKAVAHYEELPVIICPTIASSDAPCSALSVLYTDEGVFDEYLFLPANPNLVLMDTEIIANAPVRLTIAGIGDALATYFEARATLEKGAATCAGGSVTMAAISLAELCLTTLLEEGLKAKLALEAGALTESVEKIIEANTLLSGIGFESGGLAAAHAIHNGFTVIEDAHHLYHGEKVAFGTIVQLVMENLPMDELYEIISLCVDLDLPVTLEQLGVRENIEQKIRAVASAACAEGESIYNMPFEVDADAVYSAIMAADAIGRYYTSF